MVANPRGFKSPDVLIPMTVEASSPAMESVTPQTQNQMENQQELQHMIGDGSAT